MDYTLFNQLILPFFILYVNKKRGRKYDLEVLNKSAVVLLF